MNQNWDGRDSDEVCVLSRYCRSEEKRPGPWTGAVYVVKEHRIVLLRNHGSYFSSFDISAHLILGPGQGAGQQQL